MPTIEETYAKRWHAPRVLDNGGAVFNIGHRRWGATPNAGVDLTAEIQAAIDDILSIEGGGRVVAQPGQYNVNNLVLKSGVHLDFAGVHLYNPTGVFGDHTVRIGGSVSATAMPLTVNAAAGANTVTGASTTGFAAGDYVMIRDATYKYTLTGTGYGRNQEITRIDSLTGTVITLTTTLLGSYATASSAEIVKLNAVSNASIRGARLTSHLDAAAGTGGGIFVEYGYDIDIEGVKVLNGSDDACIGIEQSAFVRVRGCYVRDGQRQANGGYGYGYLIGESSHHVLVQGCQSENVREDTVTNNARHIGIIGNTAHSHYDSGWNTHGSGCEHVLFSNNVVTNSRGHGISVGFGTHTAADTNVSVIGNRIYNSGGTGISVNAPVGLENTEVNVIGNVVDGAGLVAVSQQGILVARTNDVTIYHNRIRGRNTNCVRGINVNFCDDVQILDNRIRDIPGGYGIYYQDVTGAQIGRNRIRDVSSHNIYGTVTSLAQNDADVFWNRTDDTAKSLDAGTRVQFNNWGGFADAGQVPFGSGTAVPDAYLERIGLDSVGVGIIGTNQVMQAVQKMIVGATARAAAVGLELRAAAGNARQLIFRTGLLARWTVGADGAAEAGSNAGSDFSVLAQDDAGSTLWTPLKIIRSTGAFQILKPVHQVYLAGNSGAAMTVNWNNGATQRIIVSANTTLTLSNPVAGGIYRLILVSSGAFTVAWAGGTIRWVAATAPTISTTSGRIDIVDFVYDPGTSVYLNTNLRQNLG